MADEISRYGAVAFVEIDIEHKVLIVDVVGIDLATGSHIFDD